ncbi:MAG: L-fucose/L-arabinose isomerase family protein [Desulfobacterales bacterium]|nr:L-fucose/L-arabinose isomerase family protein [Desulfobacterales bacterium]MBL7205166.1 L-fucose/L-arabinose isomerase family protein [Desulfobacteraceae bacterium]
MGKRKLGILTFSDGRQRVHEELLEINQGFLDQLVKTLEETGELDLVLGSEIIHNATQAKTEAEALKCAGVDGTVLNFSIWSFPHLSVIAAENGKGPYLLLSNLNPQSPGLIAMLAAGGCLDQVGIRHDRLWGDVKDEKVLKKILSFSRAASVVNRLKGQTCGLIGGRSMGMYIGAVDTRQWQTQFGVDLEHVDQLEIVTRAEKVPESTAEKAFQWLTERVGKIEYDGKGLTPEKLKQQIRCYYATKEIIDEMGFDFVAIKCQPELSEHYVTQCLSQAFLNDPYDMDGKKEPFATGCEADLDGALTMQILKLLTDSPVLFFDLRHYDPQDDVFVFSNCGAQTTYFAGKSENPEENLKNVTFYPQTPFFYKGGGAAVQYMCAPGEMTMARLARKDGKYWMAIIQGEFISYPEEKLKETSPEWPQGFAKLSVDADELIRGLGANHLHAVYGNYVEELKDVCDKLNIDARVF